jgi:hypothetical protein
LKNFIDTGAGVVDYDYRGPVGIVLFNHGETDFEIKRGDRIAQLILGKKSLSFILLRVIHKTRHSLFQSGSLLYKMALTHNFIIAFNQVQSCRNTQNVFVWQISRR